jgi:hypothetical protein
MSLVLQVVLGSALTAAVVALAVVSFVVWRENERQRARTRELVDGVYDDLDRSLARLRERQARRVATDVVDAARVRLGDLALSRAPPTAEAAGPPGGRSSASSTPRRRPRRRSPQRPQRPQRPRPRRRSPRHTPSGCT